MPDLKPANDSTASRETPSAFRPAPKMQMSRLAYSKEDASPSLSFASISSRCSLSAFPSAVEKQIICARAARKPPRRQGWTNTSLFQVSLVKCSQVYGHQRLHARPEASKWQHSFAVNSICILASPQNTDESSGIQYKKDTSPKLALATMSSRCSLSAFPSAVEKQIICARAARKPLRRQGWKIQCNDVNRLDVHV